MEVSWFEQVSEDVPANDDWLCDRERQTLAAMNVPKRRADWRLGRWTAKQAVATYFGLPCERESLIAIEIRPAVSGAPEAFLHNQPANVSISLSHSSGAAACAVASAGTVVGCDLELIEPRDDSFIADYFTQEERRIIAGVSDKQRDRIVTVLWSAKESALKALRTGLRLDTRSVSASLGTETLDDLDGIHRAAGWSQLRVRHKNELAFTGWWRYADRLVRTVVSLPSAVPPVPLKNIVAARS